MFKSWGRSRDIITLFHKPASQASVRVLNMLKQSSAMASEAATGDQASSHEAHEVSKRAEFDYEVSESPPTSDQLKSILEFIGTKNAGNVVSGATGEADAMKKLRENGDNFLMPVLVDWNHAQVVAGDKESEILKLLQTAPDAPSKEE